MSVAAATTSELRPAIYVSQPEASAPGVDLRQLVRERLDLSPSADPHAVVDALLDELDDDAYYEAARRGLSEIAVGEARSQRNRTGAAGRSGKWDRAADVVAERPDVFAHRICVDRRSGVWKFLGDCTVRDLAVAADLKRNQADGLMGVADAYGRLGRELRGGQVVGDLDRSKVETILNA